MKAYAGLVLGLYALHELQRSASGEQCPRVQAAQNNKQAGMALSARAIGTIPPDKPYKPDAGLSESFLDAALAAAEFRHSGYRSSPSAIMTAFPDGLRLCTGFSAARSNTDLQT